MASRAYRRDSRGRFAGANGGTKVTYGRAGGFASAAHRSRVANARTSRRNRALLGNAVRSGLRTVGIAAATYATTQVALGVATYALTGSAGASYSSRNSISAGPSSLRLVRPGRSGAYRITSLR